VIGTSLAEQVGLNLQIDLISVAVVVKGMTERVIQQSSKAFVSEYPWLRFGLTSLLVPCMMYDCLVEISVRADGTNQHGVVENLNQTRQYMFKRHLLFVFLLVGIRT
jgi:hypothetical protein